MSSDIRSEARIDALVGGIDDGFKQIVRGVGRWFASAAKARGARMFHRRSTTLSGVLVVDPAPELPPHAFFAAGARYPVIVRHANGVQDDDAAWDNRGATVRVLDPERPGDFATPLLDLLLTTGGAFLASTAFDFQRWMASGAGEREAIARAHPHIATAAWEMFRAPTSYTEVHYHSKTAFRFVTKSGEEHYVRYRLRHVDRLEDGAFVSGATTIPPDLVPRRPTDTRSPTFLHDELRARVAAGGVAYVLEVQLHRPEESALDCTRVWPEAEHRWLRVARLTLDSIAADATIEPLRFNGANAPPELALIGARTPRENASLEVMRALVYEIAASARLDLPLTPSLSALVAPTGSMRPGSMRPPAPAAAAAAEHRGSANALRVCVLGAGASGLAAAWHIRELGHDVTVLERAASVAGKCGSIQVDGLAYDLGGHLCTPQYRALHRLVKAVGAEREPATPTHLYDLETRSVVPWEEGATMREAFLRYRAVREQTFPEIGRPGLAGAAKALATPALAWFDAHGLASLAAPIGASFTSTGYGYVQNKELPAVYLAKAAETAGLLAKDGEASLEPYWTIRGGFQAFWERVAARIGKVRTGVTVSAIERRDGVVKVQVGAERLEFDRLVVATPLDEAREFLDVTLDEREVFGAVRYEDYVTTVVRAEGLPERGFYICRQNTADPRRAGHPVAFHHRHPGSNVYLFYSYLPTGPALSKDEAAREVDRLVRETVLRLGGKVLGVELSRAWKYFPHVTSREIGEGFYDRLEALQGKNGTFYVGSLFNFELIECNVAYAEALAARAFGKGQGSVEAPRAKAVARTEAELVTFLAGLAREALDLPADAEIDVDAPLEDFSLDSLAVTGLVTELSDFVGWVVPTSVVYEERTLARLAKCVAESSAELALPPLRVVSAREAAPRNAAPVPPVALPPPPPPPRLIGSRIEIRGAREMTGIRAFWRSYFGIDRWVFDDMMFGFIDQFVRKVVLEDAPALEAVKDRGCVYLANHQVSCEPALVATIVSGMSGKRVVGLAKIEGRDSDLGWLMEQFWKYPGAKNPGMYVYLDRSKPEELGRLIGELTEQLRSNERNVLVHVQGTRSTTCRQKVELLNPMFVEMALSTGSPIVPVRFTGGLPIEPLTEKIDVPYRYTQQDYFIGKPILPEELSPLGFVDRCSRVMGAINGLGPSADIEEPHPPNPEFRMAVDAWRERTKIDDFWATFWTVLSRLERPSEDSLRLIEGAQKGELVLGASPVERWLAEFAPKVYGTTGPRITARDTR